MEWGRENKVEINANSGSQVIVASDSAVVNANQNNEMINNYKTKGKFENNKKQDYIKIWNSRLFLHTDNDERPLTLADAFIMPDFEMHKSIKRIGFSSDDSFDKVIDKFISYDKTSTMLITGVPGIGKSTITSWIANMYEDDESVIILKFRDLNKKEIEEGILYAICNKLSCESEDIENKVIVLDGFDEIKVLDIRNKLLHNFFDDIKDFINFKCIITSRPAYIEIKHFQNVLEIQEFDIKKVEIFYEIITGNVLDNRKKIESNLEVLGIPVILYMAIMSKVDISENPTKPEMYNRIFAEKGASCII